MGSAAAKKSFHFAASGHFLVFERLSGEENALSLIVLAIVNQSSSSSPVSSPGRGLQVLILEPDEQVAAEILSALEQASPGARAAVAQSLSEAQNLAHDQKPALFVLDVDATYDLAQEFIYDLRTSHPGARAIILTAIHFSAQREQVAGLGAIHFFEKPFPRADFITLVEALLAPGSEGRGERALSGDLKRPPYCRHHSAQVHQQIHFDARVYRSKRRKGPGLF